MNIDEIVKLRKELMAERESKQLNIRLCEERVEKLDAYITAIELVVRQQNPQFIFPEETDPESDQDRYIRIVRAYKKEKKSNPNDWEIHEGID